MKPIDLLIICIAVLCLIIAFCLFRLEKRERDESEMSALERQEFLQVMQCIDECDLHRQASRKSSQTSKKTGGA